MDAQSRAVLAREYLPRLTKIVDSVFVITPSSPRELSLHNGRELLVVKRKGISTLHGDQ